MPRLTDDDIPVPRLIGYNTQQDRLPRYRVRYRSLWEAHRNLEPGKYNPNNIANDLTPDERAELDKLSRVGTSGFSIDAIDDYVSYLQSTRVPYNAFIGWKKGKVRKLPIYEYQDRFARLDNFMLELHPRLPEATKAEAAAIQLFTINLMTRLRGYEHISKQQMSDADIAKFAAHYYYDASKAVGDGHYGFGERAKLMLDHAIPHIKAAIANKYDYQRRMQEINSMTSPHMEGFFPAYDPNAHHAKQTFTLFDTETTDSNKIFDIYGIKLAWNIDAKRWELPEGFKAGVHDFHRVYAPGDFDKDVTKTSLVHRIFDRVMALALRVRTGGKNQSHYNIAWNQNEFESFQSFFKGTTLSGYNISGADLAWIQQKSSKNFETSSFGADTFKNAYMDVIHLAEAIYGKRRKLQDLAKDLGLSLELIAQAKGLDVSTGAHMSAPDVVLTALVMQELVRRNPDNPYVKEWEEAMNHRWIHSHAPKEDVNKIMGEGRLTHSTRATYTARMGEDSIDPYAFDSFIEEYPELKEKYVNGEISKDEVISQFVSEVYGGEDMSIENEVELLNSVERMLDAKLAGLKSNTPAWKRQEAERNSIAKEIEYLIDPKKAHGWASFNVEALSQMVSDESSEMTLHQVLALHKVNLDKAKDVRFANEILQLAGSHVYKKVAEQEAKDIAARDRKAQRQAEAQAKAEEAAKQSFLDTQIEYHAKSQEKLEDAKASGWLTRGDFTKFQDLMSELYNADDINTLTQTYKDYNREIQKTVKINQALVSSAHALGRSAPIYDWTRWEEARRYGVQSVGGAIQNLAPGFARRPIGLMTLSSTQAMESSLAEHRYQYNMFRMASNTIGGVGMALSTIPGLQIPGAIVSGIGGVAGLTSQVIGQRGEMQIVKQYQSLSSSINFVAAGLNMLLMPINLFKKGLNSVVGLFGKVRNVSLGLWGNAQQRWSQQWGMPLTSLTGIHSGSYMSMLAADTAFGFKAGTINAMHNDLAYGQAGMYTSGRFDEKRLLAAARLGIFTDVYAPMGGDTQKQMASIVNTLSGRLSKYGEGSAEAQQLMFFANDINGALPEIIQRMARWRRYGFYTGSYEGIQNGSFWSSRGVRQWQWSDRQHAGYDLRAAEFGAARMQTARSWEHVFTPAWDKIGKPFYNIFNQFLENVANELDSMQDLSELYPKIKKIARSFWDDIAKTFSLDVNKNPIDSAFDWLTEKVQDLLKTGVGQGLIDVISGALNFIDASETRLLESLKVPLSHLFDYLSDLRIGIGMKNGQLTFDVHHPEEVIAERRKEQKAAGAQRATQFNARAWKDNRVRRREDAYKRIIDILGVEGEDWEGLEKDGVSWTDRLHKYVGDEQLASLEAELETAKKQGARRDYVRIMDEYGVPITQGINKTVDTYTNGLIQSKSMANAGIQQALSRAQQSIDNLKIVVEDKTSAGVKTTVDTGVLEKIKQRANDLLQIFYKLGGTE